MTVRSKAIGSRRGAVAFALAVITTFAAGETRSQQFTLDQLSRMGGIVSAGEFPLVLGGRDRVPTIRARFYQKRAFTIADGSRHTLFVFRAANCWLREKTPAQAAAIDCRGNNGPGVFIPVLFVTPASRPRSNPSSAPDLTLRSRGANSLADYIPAELLDRVRPSGNRKVVWIRLKNSQSDSLSLSAPAVPAALVLCVPFSSLECENNASILLTDLADTPEQVASPPPPASVVRPPQTATADATPPPAPASPPPGAPTTSPATTTGEGQEPPPAVSSPPPAPAQLHYVIRPAASSIPPGWAPDRMAKRLVALLASTQGEFLLKTRGGGDAPSGFKPELTRSGDAVVAWSGDRPEGPAELIFRGADGLELVPRTQSAEPQAAPSALIDPRIRTDDFVSFAEFRIAAPFLYDQWQARIEAVTKIYGQEQPDSADDLCRFSLLIPRPGLLSFLTGPTSIGLDRIDQGGKTILRSQPVILSSQLMRASGRSLRLDVEPTAADAGCISQSKKLAPFTNATGNATAAWKLSDMPGNPSTGRMEIHPSGLMIRGRWLLGLYAPQNIGAGAEAGSRAAADAQDQIFNLLTAFLDDFRERNFQDSLPANQAVGADLALIGSADAASTVFSERSVIVGKFRQPPSDRLRSDPDGNRRLSDFLSGPGSSGGEVSFRSVGQAIRHYSQLFGEFSGQKPPVAIYVGTARALADSCLEWKKMSADVARLSGRPRVFGMVFANASADQIGRLLGENDRGTDEALAPETRALTCDGDSGSMLLFVPFPNLLSRPPEAVLGPAFNVVERWATRIRD
jgi:hypothetical protein